MEGELEMVWQSTLNENRNMQKAFLDINHRSDNKLFSSAHYKLLLDDWYLFKMIFFINWFFNNVY
jgi:hypothetical protein